MRNLYILGLAMLLLLSGCAPKFDQETEVVQDSDKKAEKAIIPRYNISDSYYKAVIPYKTGKARGIVSAYINNRLDIDEFETGLMRIAQDSYPSDKYFFQEGQYLEKDTVQDWLKRKRTDAQQKAYEVAVAKDKKNPKPLPNEGLNPIFDTSNEDPGYEAAMKKSPIYVGAIAEQNYLIKNNEDKLEVGGIVIGIGINSHHYYNLPDSMGGYPRDVEISDADIEREGKKAAEEIINRIRTKKEYASIRDIPIVVALFKQEAASSVAPGNFIMKAKVDANSSKIGKWETINEKYYFFPSNEAKNNYPDDALMVQNFSDAIAEFFPNFTAVVGRGFYKDEELKELTLTIPMQFYGKAEVIGFTQYVTGLIMEHFDNYISLQVYIESESGAESVIVRDAGESEPIVHVYN
ncbi:CamS family sex pheromone protein [Bacillus timonensis]|uniref:CamS family sex pheromone protein n=1 Tax=Bacillus timonensis TaxID=1033734 RepID=A0A4S3PMZ6_9BACI|nr:CamS family sex pheromone protein [Bacillus timonensis]THE10485.1 CamS family sex pheromone protein [Bacillus timonensis]